MVGKPLSTDSAKKPGKVRSRHPQNSGRERTKTPARKGSGAADAAGRNTEQFPIVGIGASAGGLEAITQLLKALPGNTGMAVVLVQHMDPTHESLLDKLLGKATKMPVTQVTDGMPVEPDRVYVIPPNTVMSIRKRILHLVRRPKGVGRHTPIDTFLVSLAEDQRESAIGVILSGIGSDGAVGLKAIKTEGGITFAQDEKSARYSGMPLSAVAASNVDFVSSPQGIAKEMTRQVRHPSAAFPKELPSPPWPDSSNGAIQRIFQRLRRATGVDFSNYKPGTIDRRIRRRMILCNSQELDHYIDYLDAHPAEVEALFQDILIHVTRFFREPESFGSLKTLIFPRITANRSPGEPIRIWVPGCSSGEEVYSIAIALLEHLGDRSSRTAIQIFGTDISLPDIEKARAGVYPDSAIGEMTKQRLRRFFSKVEGGYQISKNVRELCIFARHDLGQDPPFSRLDLVSCRNVLIYFGPILQKRAMATFHYALKPDGFLLMGKSESISPYSSLFAAEGRRSRVFSPKPVAPQPLLGISGVRYEHQSSPANPGETAGGRVVLRGAGERIILEQYAPPGFFVDADFNIVHFQGDTSPYLKPMPGAANFHLLKMVRPELVLGVRSAIQAAKTKGSAARQAEIRIDQNGQSGKIDIEAVPVPGSESNKLSFLVLFHKPQVGTPATPLGPVTARGDDEAMMSPTEEVERLRREINSTQASLRAIIEDHEVSGEELQAANEEALSSNEELQSTNEELETAKEELQSSNEELTTLNDELQHRNAELAQIADDLSNLLTGVEIPILILDRDRRIRRFTPSAEKVFNLVPADVGRPIGKIRTAIKTSDLEPLITRALNQIETVQQDVQDTNGRWYSLRMRPYKTSEDKVDGVLIALADIDKLKRNLERATEHQITASAERSRAIESLHESESALRESRARLRALAAKLLNSEEQRGRRLAQALHDDFNQRLTASLIDLAKLKKKVAPATMKRILRRVESALSSLSDDMSGTAHRLHPVALDLLSLAVVLRDECQGFSERAGIPVRLSRRKVPDSLPKEVGLCLFRITQEALRNIEAHSEAGKVTVTLTGRRESVRLSIKDDGRGFRPGEVKRGLGLVTMEERARALSGSLSLKTRPGKGVELVIEIPLSR
jgi:two-component system CheB/CheR fusion protein